MISQSDKTEYYANRGKYRYIKIESEQFTVYVYGHDKKQFSSLDAAVTHRDKITEVKKW